MSTFDGSDAQELIDGLAILRPYKTNAKVVSKTYMVLVPEILAADISPPDFGALSVRNWEVHPVYDCMYYPCYPKSVI